MRRHDPALLLRSDCALLLFLVAWSCAPRREVADTRTPFVLGDPTDWTYATHPAIPLSGADLRSLTAEAMQATGRFMPASGETTTATAARVSVRLISAAAGQDGHMDVQVRFEIVPPLESDSDAVVVVAAGTGGGGPAAARTAVSSALSSAIASATAEVRGHARSNAELVADLRANPASASQSLELLAARRQSAAFAPLIERLHGTDPEVAQHALAFLVSLDDARAVRPIIEEAERRSPAFKVEAVYALGSLGGEDAVGYLESLAGEPDPRIRDAASEALVVARGRTRTLTTEHAGDSQR
jgi:hypothetical protein